jgi:hypothetical protein
MSWFTRMIFGGERSKNDDGSYSHYDRKGYLTRITNDKTFTGRKKKDTIGYGPNKGKTYKHR